MDNANQRVFEQEVCKPLTAQEKAEVDQKMSPERQRESVPVAPKPTQIV